VCTPIYLDAVFTKFYDTRHLTTASALSLPSATQYSLRPYPILLYHILILSYLLRPGLQYGPFHSVLSTNATSPAHLMVLGFITRITFGNQYNHEAPYYAVFSVSFSSLCSNLLSTLCGHCSMYRNH